MKKLFTFFVFLACFLGTKAVEITDFTVDYTKDGKSPVGWKADLIQDDWITGDEDGLHLNNPEVTENFWDYQLWIFNGATLEVDMNYTVKIVAKVNSGSAKVRCKVGNWDGGILGEVDVNSTEYQEYTFSGAATTASNGLLVQFGDYVGTVSFKSVTITHEGKEERPVEWLEQLTNGDAEKSWSELGLADVKFDDMENNFKICAWSKQKGTNVNMHDDGNEGSDPFPATIEELPEGGHAFVVHAAVADTEGDASAWDNQFWIQSPQAWKAGTQIKLHFRYKASQTANTQTQIHKQKPSDYKWYQAVGDVKFTTEWQDFDKTFAMPADTQGEGWSIAFNLNSEVKDAVDFYFDDLSWQIMKLDEGFFVASANSTTGIEYDYDNAIQFEADPEDPENSVIATVGTAGKKDTWVSEVMISTIRGHAASFRGATLKCIPVADEWINYEEASNAKLKLPAAGVWTISINTKYKQMYFEQVEGDAVKEPLNPEDCINETEVVVNAVERNMSIAEAKEAGLLADPENPTDEEKALYNGQPWDNQFFLIGNRPLAVGEDVYLKFEYMAETPAQVGTQNSQGAGGYLHWAGIGNLDFTSEWQTYEGTVTIPSETSGNQDSWTFNLANMRGANKYHFKNFIFMTADKTENLLKEGTESLWVKEGASTTAYQFGTDPDGIESVVNDTKNGSNAIYNLAGQRVSKDYKGIVIKNGNKYIAK